MRCIAPRHVRLFASHPPYISRNLFSKRYGLNTNVHRRFIHGNAERTSDVVVKPATRASHCSTLSVRDVATVAAKLFVALTLISWTHEYIIDFCPAIGPSMYPLVEGSGDLLVFERLSGWVFALPNHLPWLNRVWWAALTRRIQLRRGDVVIALSTDQHPVKICKRIVAMEDDLLVFPEAAPSYVGGAVAEHGFPQVYKIPRGTVWLQGDNVADSYDSRHYGPIPTSRVLGRVICRIWPVWKFCWISKDTAPLTLQKQYKQVVDVNLDGKPLSEMIAAD